MQIGFIGLGNVGSKLAGSILRDGYDLTVRDLDESLVQNFVNQSASQANSPKELAETCDVVITCARYGGRERSPNIIRRLEDATGLSILADGFPPELFDDEPEAPGYEAFPLTR